LHKQSAGYFPTLIERPFIENTASTTGKAKEIAACRPCMVKLT
jgi:hypothetical protein